MTREEKHFAQYLAAQTKTHEEWLTVIRYGIHSVKSEQDLLIEMITIEACRQAAKVLGCKPSDDIAKIFRELGLRFELFPTIPQPTPQPTPEGC